MLFTIGLIMLVATGGILAVSDSFITIGIIANGTENVVTETFLSHSHTFKIVKHITNTKEVYNIFSSVQKLDASASVDVITLLNYDTSIVKMPQMLRTHKKKLIKMGGRPRYHQKIDGTKTEGSKTTIPCTMDLDDSRSDVYCVPATNGTTVDRDDLLLKKPVIRAVCSIVKSLKWKYVVVFYETMTEEETTTLVDGLSLGGVLFSLFNIDHVEDLKSVLLNIYLTSIADNKGINIITVCPFKCTGNILNMANEFDSVNKNKTLMKKFSKWLIVLYGHNRGASRVLQKCANDIDNIAVVAVPEFRGNDIEDVFDIIKKTVLDTQKEYLSINSHEAFKRDFLDMYQKNVQSWDPTSKCNAYHIDTLLWTKNGRQFSSVGYADINGDIVVNSDIFPNAKHGYNQRRFLISTLEYAPFVFKKMVNNSYIYEGFCIDLLEELAHKLNFTYTLTEPEDGNWGTITNEEELTFNGLVGQLQREEVDLVAAPIASQAERSPVMDFSYSYYYEYTTVLVKKPDINATKWRTLLDPFKVEVLVAIGISLLAATVLVFLLEKYNPFYDTPQHKEDRMIQGGLHELHSSFWYVFGALLCQGGVHLPQSTAGRTLISCWWLTCIIIVGTYCGNLIAFLTVTKEKPPFNTLAEMLQLKDTYKWGTVGGTSWEMAFPSSSNPTFRATGKAFLEFSKADPTILHQSPPYHINRVKNDEKYAWIGDKTSIEIAMAKECSLVSIKEEFMPLIYVFGFTNNSPHTAVFSEQMIKIHEGGLYQIWKRKWWPKSNFCAGNSIPEAKPISLMDVQSAFYVCLIGIFLGSIAFLVEYCWYKYSSYRQKRRNYSSSAVLDKQGDRPTDSRKTTTSDHKNRQTHL